MRIFSFGEEGEDSAIGVGAGGVLHDIEEVLAGNSFRVRDKAEFELRGVGLIEAEQILLSAGEAMARVQQRIRGRFLNLRRNSDAHTREQENWDASHG